LIENFFPFFEVLNDPWFLWVHNYVLSTVKLYSQIVQVRNFNFNTFSRN
jgi:hypothetical protein